jgi:hypothetical protein
MPEQDREVIPRRAIVKPRCQNCSSGGMKHPAHPDRRCTVRFEGEECACDSASSTTTCAHAPLAVSARASCTLADMRRECQRWPCRAVPDPGWPVLPSRLGQRRTDWTVVDSARSARPGCQPSADHKYDQARTDENRRKLRRHQGNRWRRRRVRAGVPTLARDRSCKYSANAPAQLKEG